MHKSLFYISLLVVGLFAHCGFAVNGSSNHCAEVLGVFETYRVDYRTAEALKRIVGRGRVGKNQEEFLQGVVMPLLGRGLLKCNLDGCTAKDFRVWRVAGETIIFEGFPASAPQLRIEWSGIADVPWVKKRDGNARVLVLPEKTGFVTNTWVKEWVPTLFPIWLKGHPLKREFDEKLSTRSGLEVLNHLPLGTTSVSRKVDANLIKPISKMLAGAITFSDLITNTYVIHPELGYIRVAETSEERGGFLKFEIGNDSYRHLENQSDIIFAIPDTEAARELAENRADAFAPNPHMAVLFSMQFLLDMKSDSKKIELYKRLSEIHSELFPAEGINGLDAFIQNMQKAILYNGIRHDELDRLIPVRIKLAIFALSIQSKLGLNLVRTGVKNWNPKIGSFSDWPTLKAHPYTFGAAQMALLKQVSYQKKDLLNVYIERLYDTGNMALVEGIEVKISELAASLSVGGALSESIPESLVDDLKNNNHHEVKVTVVEPEKDERALFNNPPPFLSIGAVYFTGDHPNNGSNWLSQELDKLDVLSNGKNEVDTQFTARHIVNAMKDIIGRLNPKEYEVITFIPVKRNQKDRSYYLAKAMSDLMGNGPTQIKTALALNNTWTGNPQKFNDGVPDKVKNTERKFQAYQAAGIKGKKVLVIVDTDSSSSDIEAARNVLLKAGAREVSVFVFAKEIRNGDLQTNDLPEINKVGAVDEGPAIFAAMPFHNNQFVQESYLREEKHSAAVEAAIKELEQNGALEAKPKSTLYAEYEVATASREVIKLFSKYSRAVLQLKSLDGLLDDSVVGKLGLGSMEAKKIHHGVSTLASYVIAKWNRRDLVKRHLPVGHLFLVEMLVARDKFVSQIMQDIAIKAQVQMKNFGTLYGEESWLKNDALISFRNQYPMVLCEVRDPDTYKALIKKMYDLDLLE